MVLREYRYRNIYFHVGVIYPILCLLSFLSARPGSDRPQTPGTRLNLAPPDRPNPIQVWIEFNIYYTHSNTCRSIIRSSNALLPSICSYSTWKHPPEEDPRKTRHIVNIPQSLRDSDVITWNKDPKEVINLQYSIHVDDFRLYPSIQSSTFHLQRTTYLITSLIFSMLFLTVEGNQKGYSNGHIHSNNQYSSFRDGSPLQQREFRCGICQTRESKFPIERFCGQQDQSRSIQRGAKGTR